MPPLPTVTEMTDDAKPENTSADDDAPAVPTADPAGDAAHGSDDPSVVIIGAGPAGLTAAFELMKQGHTSTVIEADDIVGGISRTVERDG